MSSSSVSGSDSLLYGLEYLSRSGTGIVVRPADRRRRDEFGAAAARGECTDWPLTTVVVGDVIAPVTSAVNIADGDGKGGSVDPLKGSTRDDKPSTVVVAVACKSCPLLLLSPTIGAGT